MVRVKVVFLGALRHALNVKEVYVEGEKLTGGELLKRLGEVVKGFNETVRELERRGVGVIVVRNGVALRSDDLLRDGDTVYVMPPTSGG